MARTKTTASTAYDDQIRRTAPKHSSKQAGKKKGTDTGAKASTSDQHAGHADEQVAVAKKEGFPYFQKLPVELQLEVWYQAFRKPGVHYIKMTHHLDDDNQLWYLLLKRVHGGWDHSAFRYNLGMAKVCPSAAAAFRLMTKEKMKIDLPDPKIPMLVDAATDMVVFEFDPNVIANNPWNRVYWHPLVLSLEARPLVDKFKSIRRVGITYNSDMELANSHSMFRCRSTSTHDSCSQGRVCPEEFAGFLDLFRNLSEVYVILTNTKKPPAAERKAHANYVEKWFQIPQAKRAAEGLKVFYDAKRPLVTLIDNRKRFWRLVGPEKFIDDWTCLAKAFDCEKEAIQLLHDVRPYMLMDVNPPGNRTYLMPLAKRMALTYMVMITAVNRSPVSQQH
ncbi:hypothetical protein OQA88_8087 [Cercophora sp. LCS_1]